MKKKFKKCGNELKRFRKIRMRLIDSVKSFISSKMKKKENV